VDLRLVVPKSRGKAALDEQVVEPEFNLRYAPGKIAAHIAGADIKSSDATTIAL
jgi:hypothetical protein